ncbi:DUF2835 domain-containing protein [Nitrincola tapanii]|uniref:DUF2835 family protein n=1 Tax=Nitrincola tapanii TaxID=1708751 RepID=A0A5A9W532_9GAMM|nr:DUF2835 domain-containing protein [Nitrincola tapanii]KAA0875762.1 DUF2835 family protein [Nitrincola tapanii]
MQHLIIDLFIPREEFLKYYKGIASQVNCRARDGRVVSLPVKNLLPFLTHSGVRGSFVIYFERGGKLVSINRLAQAAPVNS